MNAATTSAAAGGADATPVLSLAQVERHQFKQQQWFERLKRATGCELMAPIKALVRAIGGGAPQTIRNRGNRISIEGKEVQGYLVLGRVVFDLLEIAGALALAEVIAETRLGLAAIELPIQKAPPGRPLKAGLSVSGVTA